MADVKISGLPASSVPLAGTEVLPIVQGGQTRQVSIANVTAGRAISATTIQSTVATGTAPLTVASTTEVANLKAANATSADTANQVKSNATTGVLQVAGPGTGTTRVMTTPDANFTAARTDTGQTFSGNQIIEGTFRTRASSGDYTGVDVAYGGVDNPFVNFNMNDGSSRYRFNMNSDVDIKFQSIASGVWETAWQVDRISRNVSVNFGNLVIGTSGKGIDFSATAGTGTSELLADYEEGTWTPTDASGAGLTLTASGCTYVKVGKSVTLYGFITYPATASAAAVLLGGIPYTNATNNNGTTAPWTNNTLDYTVISTSTQLFLRTNANIDLTNAQMSGKFVAFSVTYQATT